MSVRAGDLTAPEARGKQIYLHGTSGSRTPVTASFGGDGNELPAESFPCANCHGFDGRGRPEGDVTPSNIRWTELTKSYGGERDGRAHPAYTDRTLKRAVTLGLDPSGHVLGQAMPRFHLTWQDLDDLIAYLKKLELDADPGISENALTLGVVLPPAGRTGPVADAVRAVLDAWSADCNREGGIFGRRIELKFMNALADPAKQPTALREFLEREKPFALMASYLVMSEAESARVMGDEKTPSVGAFTVLPMPDANQYIFNIDGGVADEIEALVEWVTKKRGTAGKALILGLGDARIDNPALEAFRRWGWASVELWKPGRPQDADVILSLSGETSGTLPSRSYILVPGSLQTPSIMQLPGASEGKVAVAFSWLPGQETQGAVLYRKLAADYHLPAAYAHTQFLALASAITLTEGLKRSGRELSRERLLQSLSSLSNFRNGITPPLTFTQSSRTGMHSAEIYLVSPSTKSFIPESSRP